MIIAVIVVVVAVVVLAVVAVVVVAVVVVPPLLSIYLEEQQHTNYSSCHFNRMTRIHQILKTLRQRKRQILNEKERKSGSLSKRESE